VVLPVDINKASYVELLHVPGIGPASARKIIEVRKESKIDSLKQLQKMRVVVKRAAPYIRYNGMLDWRSSLAFYLFWKVLMNHRVKTIYRKE